MIYDVLNGRIYLIGSVAQPEQPGVLTGGARPPGRGLGWASGRRQRRLGHGGSRHLRRRCRLGNRSCPPLPHLSPTVEVPPNVTTDVMGSPNAGAVYQMTYMPTNNASVALGEAMK